MITSFKPLNWHIRDDGVIYAEPKGLEYAYYIYPPNSDNEQPLIELVLFDKHGQYDDKQTTTHKNINIAQEYALNHRNNILKCYISSL